MQTDLFNNIAEIQISYSSKVKASDRPKITSSKEIVDLLNNVYDEGLVELKEEFFVIMLNRANRVLGITKISSGGISGTVADTRLIFATALKAAASSIIISHNHPSGNTQPSTSDIQLTKNIAAAGKVLEISVLDHVIYTPGGAYYSFADEGLI
jgi:DNA repair protein RadC